MPALRPPKGYKRGFSDQACRDMAERALRSELGQEALRQGWGRRLYRFVMDWASTPTKPETKAALHRAANDLQWELADLRKIEQPSELDKANLRLIEAAMAHEADLKRQFLRTETDEPSE